MALVLIAGFSIIACTALAYSFGWKLAVVVMFSAMPIIGTGNSLSFTFFPFGLFLLHESVKKIS